MNNLAAIGKFELLKALFVKLDIAGGVWQELNAQGKKWCGRNEVATANWIDRHQIPDSALIQTLSGDLDWGESETIALALAMKADLVLMDE